MKVPPVTLPAENKHLFFRTISILFFKINNIKIGTPYAYHLLLQINVGVPYHVSPNFSTVSFIATFICNACLMRIYFYEILSQFSHVVSEIVIRDSRTFYQPYQVLDKNSAHFIPTTSLNMAIN